MDASRYAELFLTESQEHLSAINHSLLELERAPGAAEPVAALFRGVHTIKGMAATMGYQAVTDLSHELESLLDRVRQHDVRIDQFEPVQNETLSFTSCIHLPNDVRSDHPVNRICHVTSLDRRADSFRESRLELLHPRHVVDEEDRAFISNVERK